MSDPTPPPPANGAGRADRSSSPAPANSSSAKRPSRDSTNGGDASTSSTPGAGTPHYGTRSRNRTGGARPNYAEDKDLDMELFEMYPERREDEPKKPSLRNAAAPSSTAATSPIPSLIDREPLRPTNGAGNGGWERIRKPLPMSSANAPDGAAGANHASSASSASSDKKPPAHALSAHHAQHKEQAQPAAAAPASGSSQSQSSNSRKRKAATAASEKPSSSNGAAHSSSAPLLNISLKKNGAAAAAAAAAAASQNSGPRGYSDTNLMTFEKCGAKPNKDGRLVADDGTVLSVNGMYSHLFFPSPFGVILTVCCQTTCTWCANRPANHTTWAG